MDFSEFSPESGLVLKNKHFRGNDDTAHAQREAELGDSVTRSGDFAPKTHFEIFSRALKLVFRVKREKRYFGRFLGSRNC